MTKEELKPIDVSKYTITETGQVLKMTKEELEKENAELKEKNKWYSEQVCNKKCAEVWGNLTEAKEIIKDLLSFVDSLGNYSGGIFAKAEQFLNCSEKPNN